MARTALREGTEQQDASTMSIAHRALGVAARELAELPESRRQTDAAIQVAAAHGLDRLAGLALTTLSSVLAFEGNTNAALEALVRAEPLLEGSDLAMLALQRATLYYHLTDYSAAARWFDDAIGIAQSCGDRAAEAMVLLNRGALLAYLGRGGAAERDLRSAEALFDVLGMLLLAADARHNLGFAAATAGRLSEALEHYAVARERYGRLGVERPNAVLDEARVLLEANLVTEAHEMAAAAVKGLRAAGQGVDLAEALLLLADASVAAGRPDAAAAAEAQRLFAAQGRPGWSTLAAFTALRLRPEADPAKARRLAGELRAAGWVDASLDALLVAGARDDLAAVARHRRRGPAARRLRGWYAQAVLRQLDGDRVGASRAAAAGVRVASAHAVSLAATDLRARAGVVVEPLVDLGVGIALEARRPRRVLVWAERWRAGGLALGTTTLPADADLSELRAVLRRLDDDALPTYRRAELDRRRRRLESEVDRRTRAAGAGLVTDATDLDVDGLREALGDRTLIEFVVHDGGVHPILVDRRGVRMLPTAELATVARELRGLRLAASRLARPGGAPPARRTAAESSAAALDRLLLGGATLSDEVVLVPSGALHAVPWPLLPSLASRACTVTPSSRLWLRAQPAPAGGRALVVAFGVPGGSAEARAVAACHPGAEVLDGAAATSTAVLAGLARADVAHLAVHATFRADNPLYSSLQLADGPLLVHDLDRLPRTPAVVVLSACGAGQASVNAGDELLGLTASFLRSGTTALIASTLPVADDLAPPLMAAFHRALREARPALALRQASADAPAHAGAAFTCFGRG